MNKARTKAITEKKHVCLQCGSAFNRPYRLKLHEKIHQNIKEFVCGEPNCKKSYTNKSHLDRHIHSAHMEPTVNVVYSCPECMKVYVNRQNLKRHIKVYHGRSTWFNCDVCSTSFKKKHQLSAHMYGHTFVKSFSCEFCSSEFITLYEKRKHMKHHKTYNCDLCDMVFVQWSKYLNHKKIMHTEYICDDCGRKFNKRVHMIRHSKFHNTQHTPTFYPCTYEHCGRVYTRNSNLKQHIKMKHLKVKHECGICSAKLSTKARLLLHLETHSKPKEYTQPTKKTGRKLRCDKGVVKTCTALRIAGLLVDPEDENIKGTLKNLIATEQDRTADSVAEHIDIADQATEVIGIASTTTKQISITDSAIEQISIVNPITEQITIADLATEHIRIADPATENICIAESGTEQNCFTDFAIEQKIKDHEAIEVLVL